MRARFPMLVCVFAAFVVAACAGPPAERQTASAPGLAWPPPPLAPRIKFVQTLTTPEEAGIRSGWFKRVITFIKGAPKKRLSSPHGIFKDSEDRLYIVDTFHKAVAVFDPRNGEHYWFPDEPVDGFQNPIGVVAGGDGRVYVTDSQSKVVHVFGDHGKTYIREFGREVLGRPTDLIVDDRTGDLLVVDTLYDQVVVFDARNLKATRFIGREGQGPENFNFPTNIARAGDGSVYVTDSMNFRVQALSPDLRFVGSFGQPGDAPGYFSRPKGVAVDSDGHVYVVDALFDNVQIFDRQGQLLLSFGSPGSAPGKFWLPNDIFIDSRDRIYVSDTYNKRIQIFQYLKEGGGQ